MAENSLNPAAELSPETPVDGLSRLSLMRQVGVMVGIAASVAIGVAVVLWSQSSSYSLLYPDLAPTDATSVMEALDGAGIGYQVDEKTGALMVEQSQIHDARMKLAALGLPKAASTGFELLDKEQSFGTSRFMERKRYQRALEGELARSIASLNQVKNARVHLAVPKQSVFVRKNKKPSASVVVELYSGRALQQEQIDAIVHMVASSVPEMDAQWVSVVDQKGRLLNSRDKDKYLGMSSTQFEYTRKLEEHYSQRVEDILSPILGAEKVRAQVSADVDFTVTEKTEESYNPDLPALRSEQSIEETNRLVPPVGIPGALTNQPPGGGEAPENADGGGAGGNSPLSQSKRATRNFELDRTVAVSRLSTGLLRRLSVAVVLDDYITTNAEGQVERRPLTAEELERYTVLVKQAVGFNNLRGDSVNIVNAPFAAPAALEPLPEVPLWEQPWVIDLAKQVIAALVVLFLVFGVLRPTMQALVAKEAESDEETDEAKLAAIREATLYGEPDAEGVMRGPDGEPILGPDGEPLKLEDSGEKPKQLEKKEDFSDLEGPMSYEERLEFARRMVAEDPKRVAQLVKSWINEEPE